MHPTTRDIVLLFSTRMTRLFAYGLISVVLGLLAGLVNLSRTPPGPLPSATGPVQVQ